MAEMCWEFKGLDGEPFMQIRSSGNNLSFELYEWAEVKKQKTGEVVREWRSAGLYPWSLQSAVDHVRDRMVRQQGGETKDVKQMAKVLNAVDARISKATRG